MMANRRAGKKPADSAGFLSVEATAIGQAQEETFARYIEPEIEVLLRVARTLTGSWSDAEDVVQDTLIRAWRAAERFDGAHPRAWLLTILRHTHLNSLRRHRPDLVGDNSSLEGGRPAFGATDATTTSGTDPERQHVDREFNAPLATALAALDPRYRTVLLLVDVDQLRYAEAAAVLSVPVGTVMSRLSRGRDKMRRQLRGMAGEGSNR